MSFQPIALIAPSLTNFNNWWLKAYEQGTQIPLAMATDATGGTTLEQAEINTQGFPITAGGDIFIPYIDGAYDLFLFPTEEEADSDITANAIQVADNIILGTADTLKEELATSAGSSLIGHLPAGAGAVATTVKAKLDVLLTVTDTMPGLLTAVTTVDFHRILGFHSSGDGGGGDFYWDSVQNKANHDGGTIIDPDNAADLATWDASAQTTWFTAGSGTGCWIRLYDSFIYPEFFGGMGDDTGTGDGTDDTKALLAFCSFVETENVEGILVNKYRITSGLTLTDDYTGSSTLSGLKYKSALIADGNFTALQVTGHCTLSDFNLDNTGGFGAPVGIGLRLTDVIHSVITSVRSDHFGTCIKIDGNFYSNEFTRTVGYDGLTAWDVDSTDNNNNVFNNCWFKGQDKGSSWTAVTHGLLFNGCDFSSLNNVSPVVQHTFTDANSIIFNNCYFEGTDGFLPSWVSFNNILSTNGTVVMINPWMRGKSSPRDGTAIQVNDEVNFTLINGWFNTFDTCIELTGSGQVSISGLKTAITNTVVDTTAFTGLLDYRRSDRISIFNSNSEVFQIHDSGTISAAVSYVDITTGVGVMWGTGTPESVHTAPVGMLFLRTDGGAGTTLYIKESGASSTGWVAK